jgi:hypothetical protein
MSLDTDPAGSPSKAYQLCMQELDRRDSQAAQVYATLSLEEAIRDLAATIVRAAHTIASASRM